MRKTVILLILLLAMGNSLPLYAQLTDDFTPPQGADMGSPAESPGRFRLLTARSQDGLTFVPTHEVILDQANVPDLVLDENGRLYLYFTGWQMGDRQNVIALAISDTMGLNWVFKHIEIEGLGNAPAGDPDVVLLPDGTFRMYATTEIERGKAGIIYAESRDGIHFEKKGTALALPQDTTIDSTTFFFNDMWHMFTLDVTSVDPLYSTSSDGVSFTFWEQMQFDGYVLSNGYEVEGGYRMFGFSIPNKDISSFVFDGESWTKEEGVRLAYDPNSALEGQYIKDPAVQYLPDGSYLMVYVTRIPE